MTNPGDIPERGLCCNCNQPASVVMREMGTHTTQMQAVTDCCESPWEMLACGWCGTGYEGAGLFLDDNGCWYCSDGCIKLDERLRQEIFKMNQEIIDK